MARPNRPLVPGGTYHVYSRARPDTHLFSDDGDRRLFLRLLAQTAGDRGWSVMSYCLMTSHFHVLVRTPAGDLDVGMHRVLGTYARRVNARRGTRGPLFSERYGAKLLQADEHLAEVIRYIALNPVRAGYCADPASWVCSSHCESAAGSSGGLLAVDDLLELVGGLTGVASPAGYLELVRSALGGETATGGRGVAPSPAKLTPLADLLSDGSPSSIQSAYGEHGYSLGAIGDALGVHKSTVGSIIAKHRRGTPTRPNVPGTTAPARPNVPGTTAPARPNVPGTAAAARANVPGTGGGGYPVRFTAQVR